MKKILFGIIIVVGVLTGLLYIIVLVKSENIYSFEECKNSGWLVRGIYDTEDVAFPKECVLWGGKTFPYIELNVY